MSVCLAACNSACPCVFWLSQCAKTCDKIWYLWPLPNSHSHEFKMPQTAADKDLSKLEKYTFISGLKTNLILGLFHYLSFTKRLINEQTWKDCVNQWKQLWSVLLCNMPEMFLWNQGNLIFTIEIYTRKKLALPQICIALNLLDPITDSVLQEWISSCPLLPAETSTDLETPCVYTCPPK